MDGSNKYEALKCIVSAKLAIASGDKWRALKFIRNARRLDRNLPVNDLIAACEKMDGASPFPSENGNHVGRSKVGGAKSEEKKNGEKSYTEEHVQCIRHINSHKDYYAVLGVKKTCSVEEIRKAYRKLSLKVHPDKNKAPGAEEAFKKVSKVFKCLSEEDSRRRYDGTGLGDEFEYNQQRRRRKANELFEDDFDPDEIFRSFFGQDMFRSRDIFKTRPRPEFKGSCSTMMFLVQFVPFVLILLLNK